MYINSLLLQFPAGSVSVMPATTEHSVPYYVAATAGEDQAATFATRTVAAVTTVSKQNN